jgi:hypothetical protein
MTIRPDSVLGLIPRPDPRNPEGHVEFLRHHQRVEGVNGEVTIDDTLEVPKTVIGWEGIVDGSRKP